MGQLADRLNSQSLAFVEDLYANYLTDPHSVSAEWREHFEGWRQAEPASVQPKLAPTFRRRSLFHGGNGRTRDGAALLTAPDQPILQERVDQLIRNYRVRGHMVAKVDPLGQQTQQPIELDPAFYGLTEADFHREFSTTSIGGPEVRTLREIIRRLRNTYCRSIGVQFMHIDSQMVRSWLQDRMEAAENRIQLTRNEQVRIFTRLNDAVLFEEFIQKKFIGAKSFSLEGAESLIPLLHLAFEKAGQDGIEEIVIGMAHRGRLNVLANIMGKNPRQIFREFEDRDPELHFGKGDVKYHLGYSHDWKTSGGRKVHLSLCFNPSHLEFVNPVVVGRVRAKQDRAGDKERQRGMALLIHGDAAFAAEGVVQETLNLSQLDGYATGGTIHVIVNNQLGFTTSPSEGRSSVYCTDVAKMLQIPIFHVNGEHPEAVAQVIRLAMDFRARFQRDVVIDMYCFRRQGHNESDEPAFTQPLLYSVIRQREPVAESYKEHVLMLGGLSADEIDRIADERREHLEAELAAARSKEYTPQTDSLRGIWSEYRGGKIDASEHYETGVEAERLKWLLEQQTRIPADFHLHPKLNRLIEHRQTMIAGDEPLDWSTAESLAFASLATEGRRVRMSGQDSARGTFSQRHAIFYDVETGQRYMPLQHLSEDQARVDIYNSPLSETGVLGFEYGYSLDYPDGLVLWEAQFGDFVNAGQVIIDQFIASAEDKWRRLSGVVLLLPHGFEGQGPEHSSARLERFLMLSAESNIQVTQPTTPGQYFHLLRRQVVRPWRKPLIVMTPKSLLRHSQCVSSFEDLAGDRFRLVLPDHQIDPKNVKRVLLCSGKIYYELLKERTECECGSVAIVRIEQFYPLPRQPLEKALKPYADETPVYWVQEEPENMGGWRFMYSHFGPWLFDRFPVTCVSRRVSASPATGSKKSHDMEQRELIETAFEDL